MSEPREWRPSADESGRRPKGGDDKGKRKNGRGAMWGWAIAAVAAASPFPAGRGTSDTSDVQDTTETSYFLFGVLWSVLSLASTLLGQFRCCRRPPGRGTMKHHTIQRNLSLRQETRARQGSHQNRHERLQGVPQKVWVTPLLLRREQHAC